ncbi:hypothetical protein ES288_A13G238800v1 [Gossypium darwinii]|uniref:Uncharacterized protein n=1 Tax=Gossypium darwinii TaxID=34276 RepID=A0A5D2E363_GOSDA|nr:hypothetical protein ES288_A13G238800v1 [Gossypium darwinii]
MSGNHESTSPISPASLKQKLKSSFRLPWQRHQNNQRLAASASMTPPSPKADDNNSPRLTSSTWLKSPEFKDKYRNLINRIGNGHRHSHSHSLGRRNSAEFRYDPSSYALNFDEGCDDSQFDEFPFRNFTARLPPSPTTNHNSREIAA